MSVRFICPAGHQWSPPSPVACPTCGSADAPADADPLPPTIALPGPLALWATTALAGPGGLEEPAFHAAAPEAPRDVPGAPAIEGYTIVEEIGRGGMGVVYRARNDALGRVEVIKTVRAGGDATAEDLKRFKKEAKAIARLEHDHIVRIFRVGTFDRGGVEVPYMALGFLEGGSLDKRIAGTPLPAREAAGVVEKIARGVQAAHDVEVVHRDLKPSNVLLTADNTPKVTDFGIAERLDDTAHAPTGYVIGTPSYMAPEQARGEDDRIDRRTDVYGLGAVLYECLTGRPPFLGESTSATIRQVLTADLVPPRALNPGVPGDLETICLKCLAKEPEKRYASAREVAEDLHRYLHNEPIRARPPGWLTRFRLWCRRPERIHDAGAFMVFFGVVSILWACSGLFHLAYDILPAQVDRRAAAQQFLGHIFLMYLPLVVIGSGTMARRRVWIWLGFAVAATDFLFCTLILLGQSFVLALFDVGGMHQDFSTRLPVFSLVGILMAVQFFGYSIALVAYYANPEAVE